MQNSVRPRIAPPLGHLAKPSQPDQNVYAQSMPYVNVLVPRLISSSSYLSIPHALPKPTHAELLTTTCTTSSPHSREVPLGQQ